MKINYSEVGNSDDALNSNSILVLLSKTINMLYAIDKINQYIVFLYNLE